MYEYRLEDKELAASGVKLDACVLCKNFQISGRGPKIGAQYGAPFNEVDWNDCNVEYSPCIPSVILCAPESSHDGLNSAGQNLALSDDRNISLGLLSESNAEHVAHHVQICPDRTPGFSFDSIQLPLLAEIVSSSMNRQYAACEDGSQTHSTAYDANDDKILLGDNETIFSKLNDLASQSMESNTHHCGSSSQHLTRPKLEPVGGEQHLELNDLSFSLADDPNSRSMLLSTDIYVQHPLDRVPSFEQDSQYYISNIANASTLTTAGSSPSVPRVDNHMT